ncbi:CHAP domain-containing protein, partial [Enterococcus faecalis]
MKRKSLKSFIYVSALLVFLSGFVGVSLFVKSEVVEATTIGDDYPVKWKNLPLGGAIDDWRMYTRYCTSFVAYRLSTANNFELPSGFGNADRWGTEAMARGYKVDKNPKVGSVAWWTSTHVAWVAEVSGDNVKVEEYNYGFDGKYNTRWINKNSANGYIHFKDMPQTPVGWYNNGHYDYYYYADGTKAIGLTWVGTKRYNFDKNGAMYKNAWTNSDKYSYYSTSDGSLAVGLTWVGTKRYNFDKNGAMYKNAWTNSDKYSYYSTSDGSLAVGLTWVGTKRYN